MRQRPHWLGNREKAKKLEYNCTDFEDFDESTEAVLSLPLSIYGYKGFVSHVCVRLRAHSLALGRMARTARARAPYRTWTTALTALNFSPSSTILLLILSRWLCRVTNQLQDLCCHQSVKLQLSNWRHGSYSNSLKDHQLAEHFTNVLIKDCPWPCNGQCTVSKL